MEDGPTTYTVPVPADKGRSRLDRFLADALPFLSRNRLKALIVEGQVSRDGQPCHNPAHKVIDGQTYVVSVAPARPAAPEPQDIPLDVIYEDDQLIVINKPAGLVVHPAAGNPDRTLVNALLAHCADGLSGIGGVRRPGILHRLDKDTSGLMVAAKTDSAHRALAAQFAAHDLDRAYQALVWGRPNPSEGEIATRIGRSPRNRKKMAVLARGGKEALTRYRILRPVGTQASLVECRLATGRTHQIRVHMAHLGNGLIGDPLYGRAGRRRNLPLSDQLNRLSGQLLHAYVIGFRHPLSGESMRFEINLSHNINDFIKKLELI